MYEGRRLKPIEQDENAKAGWAGDPALSLTAGISKL